jgi:phosphoenolpyruvate-protein phosphotransferase (PTS system enzyme I)
VWFEHVTLGTVAVSPDATEARDAVERARRTAALMAGWTGPGATSDGHPVSILANVQDGSAALAARETPAEGVGLFPTELCFLNRETEPSVADQAQIYGEVLEAFSGQKVVIRRRVGQAAEVRPSSGRGEPDWGVRGMRIAQGNPGLVERQLEAIASAAAQTGNPPWVLAPMIATADEANHFAAHARSYGLTRPG